MFFLPSLLVGPTVEYREYEEYINRSMFKHKEIPNSFIPTILHVGIAVIWCGLHTLNFWIPYPNVPYIPDFNAVPFYKRVFFILFIGFLERSKYYFIWSMSNAAFILCGAGYRLEVSEGSTSKDVEPKYEVKWDRFKNAHPLKLEFLENVYMLNSLWNVRSGDWLKNYIYLRIQQHPSVAKILEPTMSTFVVSALWHGLFPSYYCFFITLGLLTIVARIVRRKLRPYFLGKGKAVKNIYDVIGFAASSMSINYAAVSYLCLYWKNTIEYYSSVYYFVHVLSIGIAVILQAFPTPRQEKSEKRT